MCEKIRYVIRFSAQTRSPDGRTGHRAKHVPRLHQQEIRGEEIRTRGEKSDHEAKIAVVRVAYLRKTACSQSKSPRRTSGQDTLTEVALLYNEGLLISFLPRSKKIRFVKSLIIVVSPSSLTSSTARPAASANPGVNTYPSRLPFFCQVFPLTTKSSVQVAIPSTKALNSATYINSNFLADR